MTLSIDDSDARLQASWEANAAAWTAAVREQRIPSRRAGTDAAILRACTSAGGSTALDVGCGEGWLTRALAAQGLQVLGIDASAGLIERAQSHALSGGRPTFAVLSYQALIADHGTLPGPWDLIVCNFALLGDPLVPLLGALSARLGPSAQLLVQTVHPWVAAGDGPYSSGWREETFAGFDVAFPSPMPWFFRTLASWMEQLAAAGLGVRAIEEPLHPESGRPLSMLLRCAAS